MHSVDVFLKGLENSPRALKDTDLAKPVQCRFFHESGGDKSVTDPHDPGRGVFVSWPQHVVLIAVLPTQDVVVEEG